MKINTVFGKVISSILIASLVMFVSLFCSVAICHFLNIFHNWGLAVILTLSFVYWYWFSYKVISNE